MSDKPPTARSFRGTLVDDNMVFSFRIKWLGQILVLCGMLVDRHIIDEQQRYKKMEEELQWYQKELNLNPLSWRKKKKK